MRRLIGMVVLACLALAGCGADVPETPNAFRVKVLNVEVKKRHAINRTRCWVDVVPEKNVELNQKSLGDSAIRVALATAEQVQADVFFVSLHQSEDIYSDKFFSPLAKCTYVPDGKDIGGEGELTWDVRAAHEKVPLNIIDMACLWRQERHKFIAPREMEINGKTIVDNEYLDEDALVAHLSAMTNVPEDKVTINHFKAFVTEYFKQ